MFTFPIFFDVRLFAWGAVISEEKARKFSLFTYPVICSLLWLRNEDFGG